MAGAFTHFLICNAALKERALADETLRRLLNRYSLFVFLGAVSPDLPYLSFRTGAVNWADLMHYENTNGIAVNGHGVLRQSWASNVEPDRAKFAWLMGYVSHVVADVTIHPIVQAVVGEYSQHKEEHRICEMTQDVLVYRERMNAELRYGEFADAVRYCKESPHFSMVMDFWTQQAQRTYGRIAEVPDPRLWLTTYTAALDFADGESGVSALFRHAGIGRTFIYKTSDEIRTKNPDLYAKYFSNVRLPDNTYGNFAAAGFDRAVSSVVDAWNSFYRGLSGGLDVAGLVRNRNLDTGELIA